MASRKNLLAIALVSLLVLAFLGTNVLSISPIGGIDTNSKYYELRLDELNPLWTSYGGFNGEFFDAPEYVSGFYASDESETIVVEGKFTRLDIRLLCGIITQYRWVVEFESVDGGKETLVDFSESTGNVGLCPADIGTTAKIAKVDGNEIGILHAFLYGKFTTFQSEPWRLFGEDHALLQPGYAKIEVLNEDKLVEVGEDLVIRVDVGAASSTKFGQEGKGGWLLKIVDVEEGTVLLTDTISNYVSKELRIPVPASWFTIGKENRHEIQLFNQLTLQSARDFVTIDDRTLAPGTPEVTIDPPTGPYTQGMRIKLTAFSEPNSKTGNEIEYYHFKVFQGGEKIAEEKTQGTFSFTIKNDEIDITIEVSAFDGERSGGLTSISLTVDDIDANKKNDPSKGLNQGVPIWLWLVVAAIILVIIALFIPLPIWPHRVVIGLVGVIFLLAGILVI